MFRGDVVDDVDRERPRFIIKAYTQCTYLSHFLCSLSLSQDSELSYNASNRRPIRGISFFGWGDFVTKVIGGPTEVKEGERRVAPDPHAVALLSTSGLRVLVQRGTSNSAGFSGDQYRGGDGELVDDADSVGGAELVVKVKQPPASERRDFRQGLQLFGYLHPAAAPELVSAVQRSGTLLGGSTGVPPARVVVIGMGIAGTMPARGARGMVSR